MSNTVEKGQKNRIWLKALVMALCPLVCALVMCALQGGSLLDIYLPASEWNDELFYYKLTEGVIEYGYPQGYFGFNESHGIYLSFAAWSPVLLFPWVIWGKLLGWNILSPVFCNLFLMMVTYALLAVLLRPTWKQVLAMMLPLAVYSQMTRYMLSGMPEAIHWCLMLLILGLYLSYAAVRPVEEATSGRPVKDRGRKRESSRKKVVEKASGAETVPGAEVDRQDRKVKVDDASRVDSKAVTAELVRKPGNNGTWKLVTAVALTMLLTWMRPYFILLLLFPAIVLIRKNRGHILTMTAVLGVTGGVYYLLSHYLSAPYFVDLFYTDWVKAFGERGLFGGLLYTLHKLWSSFAFICSMALQCLKTGHASGGLYMGFLLVGVLLLIRFLRMCSACVSARRKVKSFGLHTSVRENFTDIVGENPAAGEPLELYVQLLFCYLGFFTAILLMYRLQEGGRHVIAFVAAGILLLAMGSGKTEVGDQSTTSDKRPAVEVSNMQPGNGTDRNAAGETGNRQAQILKRGIQKLGGVCTMAVLVLAFGFIYILRANTPYDFQIPFATAELKSEIGTLQQDLQQKLTLETENTPTFDNTVIWVFTDQVGEETKMVQWQQLYAVPSGFGINLCYAEYVKEQDTAGTLRSRYVATIPEGDLAKYLETQGYPIVAENEDIVIFRR